MRVGPEACPLRVQLQVEADGELVAERAYSLLCRKIDDRITFIYLDADGSPQVLTPFSRLGLRGARALNATGQSRVTPSPR